MHVQNNLEFSAHVQDLISTLSCVWYIYFTLPKVGIKS